MSRELLRTASWRALLWEGSETCSLYALANGWELQGAGSAGFTISTPAPAQLGPTPDSAVFAYAYVVQANAAWETQRVTVEVSCDAPKLRHTCSLSVGRNGLWKQRSGDRAPNLQFFDDCVDFSMDVAPGLYTQQLRRLDLREGDTDDLGAARLHLPGLASDLIVTYVERTGADAYVIEEELPSGVFTDEVTIDDLGLIVTSKRWERVIGEA